MKYVGIFGYLIVSLALSPWFTFGNQSNLRNVLILLSTCSTMNALRTVIRLWRGVENFVLISR
jgi:hypothetical protein